MEIPFNKFREDPWIDLKQIDVEVVWYLGKSINQINAFFNKKTIVPSDDLADYMKDISQFNKYEYDVRLVSGNRPGIAGYGKYNGSYRSQVFFMYINRVTFKSGIFLKTHEDIASHLFPHYNRAIMREQDAKYKYSRMLRGSF